MFNVENLRNKLEPLITYVMTYGYEQSFTRQPLLFFIFLLMCHKNAACLVSEKSQSFPTKEQLSLRLVLSTDSGDLHKC